jgi:endo-1,3(4)-beta-glucanase
MILAILMLTFFQVGNCRLTTEDHLDGHLYARVTIHQEAQEAQGVALPVNLPTISGISLDPEAKSLPVVVPANQKRPNTIATVQVITSIFRFGTAQILPSPSDRTPDTTGSIEKNLEIQGRRTDPPLLTSSIEKPTSLLSATATTPPAAAVKFNMASPDIFADPIATEAPPANIARRQDHPVPRLGIAWTPPLSTNKFYANKFLGNQTCPDFLHPYSVAWAKGQGASKSWGMAISHIEAKQRVFGPTSSTTGASSYFINPIGIQSLCISAQELGSATAMTTDQLRDFSVRVNLRPSAGASAAAMFPLVQGAAFVTAIFNGAHPQIESGVFFRSVVRSSTDPKSGVTKYKLLLEDGTTWLLYAYGTQGNPLNLQVVNNGMARATSPFYGTVQVAKDPGNGEAMYDQACGAYATGVELSGTASGTTGTYTFKFQKGGMSGVKLAMFALPHHQASFDGATKAAMTQVRLQTTTKGVAVAVLNDSWQMVESTLPTGMGFVPWSPTSGSRTALSQGTKDFIHNVALQEVSQDMDQQSNLDSMYFSGKVCEIQRALLDLPSLTLFRHSPNSRQLS